DDSRDFVIVGGCARRGQFFKIPDTPAGAHPLQELSHKCPIETDFEVGVAKASLFESERQSSNLAMSCHYGPNTTDRLAEIYALPARPRFGLNKASSAPFPWWEREFFDDGLSGIGKFKLSVARRVEVDAADTDPNRLDSVQPGRSGSGHNIG